MSQTPEMFVAYPEWAGRDRAADGAAAAVWLPRSCIGMLSVSRAVQAAIEAMMQIAALSSATGTHAFGPSPWTATATTGAILM